MGAHYVINHREPIDVALRAAGIESVEYVAALGSIKDRMGEIGSVIAPQGHLAVIVDEEFDILPLKAKSITISWEMVFTRSLFATDDMAAQRIILDQVADLVDEGLVRHTATQNMGHLTASALQAAHALNEGGRSIGKVVLEVAS